MSSDLQSALVANHAKFLEQHRGPIAVRDGIRFVKSARLDFRIAIIDRPLPKGFSPEGTVIFFVTPSGSREDLEDVCGPLETAYTLSYMTHSGRRPQRAASEPIEISKVNPGGPLCLFTFVQTGGFSPDFPDFERSFPWMLEMNQNAIAQKEQRFFLLRASGEPAAVIVTVETRAVLGIYAVATLPRFRNRGFSSALLGHALDRAKSRRIETVALQVMAGSYAEAFYKKLGFEEAFRVAALKRRS